MTTKGTQTPSVMFIEMALEAINAEAVTAGIEAVKEFRALGARIDGILTSSDFSDLEKGYLLGLRTSDLVRQMTRQDDGDEGGKVDHADDKNGCDNEK